MLIGQHFIKSHHCELLDSESQSLDNEIQVVTIKEDEFECELFENIPDQSKTKDFEMISLRKMNAERYSNSGYGEIRRDI